MSTNKTSDEIDEICLAYQNGDLDKKDAVEIILEKFTKMSSKVKKKYGIYRYGNLYYSVSAVGEKLLTNLLDDYDSQEGYSLCTYIGGSFRKASDMAKGLMSVASKPDDVTWESVLELLNMEHSSEYVKRNRTINMLRTILKTVVGETDDKGQTTGIADLKRLTEEQKASFMQIVRETENIKTLTWKQIFNLIGIHERTSLDKTKTGDDGREVCIGDIVPNKNRDLSTDDHPDYDRVEYLPLFQDAILTKGGKLVRKQLATRALAKGHILQCCDYSDSDAVFEWETAEAFIDETSPVRYEECVSKAGEIFLDDFYQKLEDRNCLDNYDNMIDTFGKEGFKHISGYGQRTIDGEAPTVFFCYVLALVQLSHHFNDDDISRALELGRVPPRAAMQYI